MRFFIISLFFLISSYSFADEKISQIEAAASQGEVIAQNKLGYLYYMGKGVPQDYKKALIWYRKAAEQDLSEAQTKFGGMYYLSFSEAQVEAQVRIGSMYLKGLGVPQDYKESLIWYRRAAEQGFSWAQTKLGGMYYLGLGVPQDYKESLKWYRRAAEQGLSEAQTKLGGMYYLSFSEAQIEAQIRIGDMYYEGEGVPQDYKEALIWYRRAAEQGSSEAQEKIGLMYYIGFGVPQDYKKSYAWLNIAASQGDADVISWRDKLEGKLTKKSLLEAQQLSKEYVKSSHGLN